MKNQEQNIRIALKSNAAFSLLSGGTLIVFSKTIAAEMNIANHYILMGIGVGLLLFAGSILAIAFSKEVQPKKVRSIIWQDWGWVAGSTILLALRPYNISLTAHLAIALVALVVLFFALWQAKAVRSLERSPG